jgi:protein SCO1/2
MQRPWIWLLIAAPMVTVITVIALIVSNGSESQTGSGSVRTSGEADIGGAFELVDHTGRPVTEADFLGRPMLIYFGYSYCPDVCPFSLQIMAAALDRLDAEGRARIQPVLITVDPERDTVEHLAQYVSSPAFPDGLIGLTGTPEQITAVTRAYRVAYRRADSEEGSDYLMDHTSIIYLMGSDGRFVDIFTHGADPAMVAARLQDFLEEDGSSS